MAESNGTAKFFEALNESYDALIDGVKVANDRGRRVSASLIEDAHQGQREVVELAKKWAEAPADLAGFYGSLLEATTKAQTRALEITRQLFGELTEAQKENRDVLQRIADANRSAGKAAVDLSRGIFNRTSEALRSTDRAGGAETAGGEGKTPRERSQSSPPHEVEDSPES